MEYIYTNVAGGIQMLRIAICDNDKAICSQIEAIILKYCARNSLKSDIEVFYSGESLLSHIMQGNQFDLIYLDIEMDQINGIEVGRQIRKEMKDYTTEIVYVSGKDEYDRQLFEVQPLHFIPKPIASNAVIDDLKLAIERSKTLHGIFYYKKGCDKFKVPIKDILYFESVGRKIKIMIAHKEDYFIGNLDDVLKNVSKEQFKKIHRSYLINFNHVSIFRYDELVMSNGDILPISQSKRKAIREIQVGRE